MITRIVSCFALPQSFPLFAYRGINIPLLCSYRGVSQGHSPTLVQAQVGSDLLTLYNHGIILTDGKRGAMVSCISNEPHNRLKGSELLAGNLKPGEVDLSADQGDD